MLSEIVILSDLDSNGPIVMSKLKSRTYNQPIQPTAFTLVELLVVIAIIGILVAMLLPAVQAAREAARRANCQSNLKNVSLAVLLYEGASSRLPVGMRTSLTSGTRKLENDKRFGESWTISILPYMEEQSVFDLFDLTKPIAGGGLSQGSSGNNWQNVQARGTEIEVFLCPSDPFSIDAYRDKTVATSARSFGDNWARGNYGANTGSGLIWGRYNSTDATDPLGQYNTGPKSSGWKNDLRRGVFGINTSLKLRQISDGLSKTMMLGELRSGVTSTDPRGTWAFGHAGGNILAGFGYLGDDNGPNTCNANADDVPAGSVDCIGEDQDIADGFCMPCFNGSGAAQATTRSAHPGGVMIALCDGSATFINNDIVPGDTPVNSRGLPLCCSPWDHLIASSDGEAPEEP